MKKLCIIHIALLSAVCLAAPTANEDFVIAEDARTYTNAVQAAKTYTDQATNGLLRTEEVPAWAKSPTPPQTITTNDVCNIVTNEVDGWEFTGLPSGAIVEPGYPSWAVGIGWQLLFTHGGVLYFGTTKSYPENATAVTINCIPQSGQQMYSVSMVLRRGNALGLASVALLSSASTASSNYTDTAIANLPPALSTNDVCNIVTNEVPAEFSKWTLCTNGVPFVTGIVFEFVEMLGEWELHDVNFGDGQICRFETITVNASIDALTLEMIGYVGGSDQDDDEMWYGNVVAVRTFTPSRNALGLARLVDLPPLTNGLATAESLASLSSQLSQASQAATNYTDVATSNVVPSKSIGGYAIATNVAVEVGYGIRFLSLNDFGIDYMSVIKPAIDLPYPFQWNLPTYDDIYKLEMTLVDNYALFDVADAATNYTDSAISSADTTYTRFAISAPTNINQSVQYINITDENPSFLSVVIPEGTGTKDWIIYVNSRTNVAISLPAATWWLADTSATNDIAPQTPTALYFSQAADNIYTMGRQEFTEVVLP